MNDEKNKITYSTKTTKMKSMAQMFMLALLILGVNITYGQTTIYSNDSTHQASDQTITVTSTSLDTKCMSDLKMSFNLAAFSKNKGHGMESGDYVLISVSKDGGSSYIPTLKIVGKNKSIWEYSASGSVTTLYDGDNDLVVFESSNNGPSTARINGLPNSSQLRIQIQMHSTHKHRDWEIKNFIITRGVVETLSVATPLSNGDLVWVGNTSTDYLLASNWLRYMNNSFASATSFPTTSTNVIIPKVQACVSNIPSLGNNTVNAKNLTIESGAIINMNNGKMNVAGNLKNYGTFNQGTSTVNMIGSSTEDLILGTETSNTFYNLTINKSGGVEASLGSHINVTNELRVKSKNLRLNSLHIDLGTTGTLLEEGPGHRIYCDCSEGYIMRTINIPANISNWNPGNLGLTISTHANKMGVTVIKRRHMRAGSNNSGMLSSGKPGVYRIFDVEPEFNGESTYPLASGGLNVDLKFQYYIDEVGSEILTMEDQFMLWRSGNTGSTWQALGGNVNVLNKTISITAWPQFSWLTGGPSPSALPIKLISFQANCSEDNSIAITWSTASERNASHYLVEKSIDGQIWSTIGQAQATGNSTLLSTYELSDFSKLAGVIYYRLTQFDINGNSESFDPVSLNCISATKKNQITTYPNPSSEGFTVSFYTESAEENGQLTMMDASGRSVYQEAVIISKGNTNFQIGNLDVQPGIYYIHLSNGTTTEVVKHILR